MRSFAIVCALTFISLIGVAHAASDSQAAVGQITMAPPAVKSDMVTTTNNFSELSFDYSSLNRGSTYAGVALVHEWNSGFALGLRGETPLQFNSRLQIYMAELLGRLMILNDTNQMYIELSGTRGFANDSVGTSSFNMIGLTYGFNHQINRDYSVGAMLGIGRSDSRIQDDSLSSVSTFYSKVALTGGYHF